MKVQNKMKLVLRDDYSATPGPRYEVEGDDSGEVFRIKCLYPKVREAISSNSLLVVDLDGTAGYGTSFLEEAFGGLIRNDGVTYEQLKNHLSIVSAEEEYLVDDIESYLLDAAKSAAK